MQISRSDSRNLHAFFMYIAMPAYTKNAVNSISDEADKKIIATFAP